MKKSTGGAPNKFQRDYLEANLKGTNYKGSEVIAVTNKYIVTKDGNHPKAGAIVSFREREGTAEMIRSRPDHDTESSRL